MVLIIYEYVGKDYRYCYHENCDFQIYMDEVNWKKALIRFWVGTGHDSSKIERRNRKNDFKIKNILTSVFEIKKFLDNYWDNEPPYQELWK